MTAEETKQTIINIIINLNDEQLNKIIDYLNYMILTSDGN